MNHRPIPMQIQKNDGKNKWQDSLEPYHFQQKIPLFGAEDGTRTRDPRITNALLYQLSHFGSIFASQTASLSNLRVQR